MTPINQKGQASVFVLAFIGVILVCTIFLYQSGRITTEKMQLQNAADAAAFSASTLEARSLNFCAYTNRAMVANEVGIGQMIGLLSLTDEIKEIGTNFVEFSSAIEAILNAIPIVGNAIALALDPILVPIETIGNILMDAGTDMEEVLAKIASPVIRTLSIVNEVYSYSQIAYHGATIFMVTTTIFKNIEDNVPGTAPFKMKDIFDPNRPGAHLSTLGFFALAGHIPSYWSGYTKRYKLDGIKENDGMKKMAGTIRGARDLFSSGAKVDGWDDSTLETRDWHLGIEINPQVKIDLPLDVKVKVWLDFKTGMDSQGASELRYKETNYNWSAIDTSIFLLEISAGYKVTSPLGDSSESIDFPIPIPTGGGGYQAISDSRLTFNDDMPNGLRTNTSIPGAYGYGTKEKSLLSWEQAAWEMEENSITTYSGLAPYRGMGKKDQKKPAYTPPFISPFYLVGVVRKVDDIQKSGPKFSGNLNILKEHPEITEIGAIAKSEIYYKRPTDLTYFLRGDKKTEKENVFGPFWQARLSKTSDIDRFLALAIQHKTIWLAKHEAAKVPGLENIEKMLMKLLNIF